MNISHILQGRNKYTTVDAFCGMGAMRHGFESTGRFETVYSVEIDPDARNTYRNNFGMEPEGADIRNVIGADVPKPVVLFGGFPCPAFSISGNRLGFGDPSGQLFFDLMRIAEATHPKAIVLENVKNLVSHDGGRTLKIMINRLKRLGYKVVYRVLNACHFGVPQARERIFIVAIRKDIPAVFEFPEPHWDQGCVADILLPDSETSHLVIRRDDIVLRPEHTFPKSPVDRTVCVGSLGKGGQGYRIYHPLGQGITLSAEGGGVGARTGLYFVNGKVRRLAPRECARLQGLQDTFVLPENPVAAYRQLGNAVAAPLVAEIAQNLASALDWALMMPKAA
ncbi:MAG: DNA (cytosine-5-)-methyltransferase [Betaproteobacteria bacterium]